MVCVHRHLLVSAFEKGESGRIRFLHLYYHNREACNQAFDRMPLAGVIDQDIFCVHGGIPRPVSSNPGATRIQDILAVPKVAGM